MKQLAAFTQKEFLELFRTGRFLVLAIIFLLFGIMSPAIAKLTPWMMELFSESLAESGMAITEVRVDVMTSWAQFYKNIPIAMIIFFILFSNILTGEYQKGTLTNMLTKGLSRWKVLAAKGFTVLLLWTICFWLCFGVTYAYNEYFWGNGSVPYLFLSGLCIWLLGVWLISLLLLASSIFRTGSAVLLAGGGVFLLSYLLGILPALSRWTPIYLFAASGLQAGASPSEFLPAAAVTVLLSAAAAAASIPALARQNL